MQIHSRVVAWNEHGAVGQLSQPDVDVCILSVQERDRERHVIVCIVRGAVERRRARSAPVRGGSDVAVLLRHQGP